MLNLKYALYAKDNILKNIDDHQAKKRRTQKEIVYSKLPSGLRAIIYYIYRYFLRFGFLDGKPDMYYHFMQVSWYRLLVDIKVHEVEKLSKGDQKSNETDNSGKTGYCSRMMSGQVSLHLCEVS